MVNHLLPCKLNSFYAKGDSVPADLAQYALPKREDHTPLGVDEIAMATLLERPFSDWKKRDPNTGDASFYLELKAPRPSPFGDHPDRSEFDTCGYLVVSQVLDYTNHRAEYLTRFIVDNSFASPSAQTSPGGQRTESTDSKPSRWLSRNEIARDIFKDLERKEKFLDSLEKLLDTTDPWKWTSSHEEGEHGEDRISIFIPNGESSAQLTLNRIPRMDPTSGQQVYDERYELNEVVEKSTSVAYDYQNIEQLFRNAHHMLRLKATLDAAGMEQQGYMGIAVTERFASRTVPFWRVTLPAGEGISYTALVHQDAADTNDMRRPVLLYFQGEKFVTFNPYMCAKGADVAENIVRYRSKPQGRAFGNIVDSIEQRPPEVTRWHDSKENKNGLTFTLRFPNFTVDVSRWDGTTERETEFSFEITNGRSKDQSQLPHFGKEARALFRYAERKWNQSQQK
ncbi:MAG: hypothetical protein KDD70_05380 [Bdellovibrionales bacterium]|nr:hypothetical protein [Bdellovibrionales bacterium]